MRFSLAIAATLATIAGSVISTPGPPHARALEQGSLFDVDIYSRNHEIYHKSVAEKLEPAIDATKSAIDHTGHAITHGDPGLRPKWTSENAHHKTMLPLLLGMQQEHSGAAMLPYKTPLFNKVHETLGHVDAVAKDAHRSSSQAQQAVISYKRHNTQKAYGALRSAELITRRAIHHAQHMIALIPDSDKNLEQKTNWRNRHAKLQEMLSQLKEMHQACRNASKEYPSYFMEVSARAADIAHRVRSLDKKARSSLGHKGRLK